MKEAMKVMDAFLQGDISMLRNLSDEILAKGAIEENKELVKLAVIAHSLAKILEKKYYRREKKLWRDFVNRVVEGLKKAGKNVKGLEEIENAIIELDREHGRYTDNVLHLSKVRRGSTLYAWGLSLGVASKLVDVPEHEILSHTGKTKMVDEESVSKSASERLKEAEEVL